MIGFWSNWLKLLNFNLCFKHALIIMKLKESSAVCTTVLAVSYFSSWFAQLSRSIIIHHSAHLEASFIMEDMRNFLAENLAALLFAQSYDCCSHMPLALGWCIHRKSIYDIAGVIYQNLWWIGKVWFSVATSFFCLSLPREKISPTSFKICLLVVRIIAFLINQFLLGFVWKSTLSFFKNQYIFS